MDRKVAALCEDISNANDELDDLDDEDEDDEDAPVKAQSRQVSHLRELWLRRLRLSCQVA